MTDTDLYTFTVGQAVQQHYPGVLVEYELRVRSEVEFPDGFGHELMRHLDELKALRFVKEELSFLNSLPYIKENYIEWLSQYRFNANEEVFVEQQDGKISVKIRGRWERTVFWEIPILATISELYYKMTGKEPVNGWKDRTIQKALDLSEIGVNFMEFGTRRRFSFDVQSEVIQILSNNAPEYFKGTSNVFHGMTTGLTVFGTMSHQWIQGNSAVHGVAAANLHAMKNWIETYRGMVGIALPDTYGLDNFLLHFDSLYARIFEGSRHDSGDPFTYVDKMVAHYLSELIKVDPTTKYAVFSDSLKNIDIIRKIHEYCMNKIRDSYGIGTYFTNDVGHEPLNIVIKLFRLFWHNRWNEVVKTSDSPGKATGDESALIAAQYSLGIINTLKH